MRTFKIREQKGTAINTSTHLGVAEVHQALRDIFKRTERIFPTAWWQQAVQSKGAQKFEYNFGIDHKVKVNETTERNAMTHIEFTVTGKGVFPFDMLRYDRCYPVDNSSPLYPNNDNYADRQGILTYSDRSARFRIFFWR